MAYEMVVTWLGKQDTDMDANELRACLREAVRELMHERERRSALEVEGLYALASAANRRVSAPKEVAAPDPTGAENG